MFRRISVAFLLFFVIVLPAMLVCGCRDDSEALVSMQSEQAQNPDPADGSTGVGVTTNLNWDAGALAESYDLYFGTNQAAVENATRLRPEFGGNIPVPGFDPSPIGNLSYDTIYCWRVDSVNQYGTTKGAVWTFTTASAPSSAPDKVASPVPAHGSTDVPTDQVLSWGAAAGAESYDVYFGTDHAAVDSATTSSTQFMGGRTSVTYEPGTLDYMRAYYWRVDSVNSAGTTKGDVWQFRTEAATPPAKVTSPTPFDGETDVPVTQALSWGSASEAQSYDVYLGTDQAAITSATTASTQFMGNTTNLSYDPASLDYSTTYYWRIDSAGPGGTTKGDVWQFATEAAPTTPPVKVASPVPSDGAPDMPIDQVLSWAAASGAETYDIYLGTVETDVESATTSSTEFMENTENLSYDPAGLNTWITYYWRVDSRNTAGTTTGDIWSFITAAVPVADFTATPASGAAPLTVSFSGACTGVVTSWEWDFDNDGTFDAFTQDATLIYSAAGAYDVKLKVTGPGGTDETVKNNYIIVYPAPVADFAGNPASGPAPLTVSFTDASTGTITAWEWDFENDGTFDAFTQDATHIYSAAGTFDVKLKVTGPGGTDETVKNNYITVYGAPVADFAGDPASGPVPLTLSFADTSTGVITVWEWDFENDGTFDAFTQDATHIYTTAGTFDVKLKVTGPGGTGEIVKNSYVTTYDPPEADFTATPTIGTSPLTVSFTGASTGGITSWEWDFENDGTFDAFTQDATGIYLGLGSYTVSLRVSGPGGEDTEIKTSFIRVVDGLTIVTRRLPYAQVNVAYSQTLEAFGGVPAYSYQVVAGSLPNGLNLNAAGIISGTPTVAGGSSFTVEVTDSLTDSATQLLAISVDPDGAVYVRVAKDGTADFTTISDALASLPDPLDAPYVIEILDNGTYRENLTISVSTGFGADLGLRSAYNRLATIEAADANSHTIYVDALMVSIQRLRISGASGADMAGVKLAPMTWMLTVRNCVIFNNDIAIDTGANFAVFLTANTCYGPRGIWASGGGSAALFNNIVYATGDWCIQSTNCSADFNLYYAPSGNVGFDGTSYYTTLADWQAFMGETNSRYGDPNFRDMGGNDFHLTDSSTEAIDNGNVGIGPGGLLILDAEGFARPQGIGIDIGAYEHR